MATARGLMLLMLLSPTVIVMASSDLWYDDWTTSERTMNLSEVFWYYSLYDHTDCVSSVSSCSYTPSEAYNSSWYGPTSFYNPQTVTFATSIPADPLGRVDFTPSVTAISDAPCIDFSNNRFEVPFTVAVWVYPKDVPGADDSQTIFRFKPADEFSLTFAFGVPDVGYGYSSTPNTGSSVPGIPTAYDAWTHIAVTMEKLPYENGVRVTYWLNGTLIRNVKVNYKPVQILSGLGSHSVGCRVEGGSVSSKFRGYLAHYTLLNGVDETRISILAGIPPTMAPTREPTMTPTRRPTAGPTSEPTAVPTVMPTAVPTVMPTAVPTEIPTVVPSKEPTQDPTLEPTGEPTYEPTQDPTLEPTYEPTLDPTSVPSSIPTTVPTAGTTAAPQNQRSSSLSIRGSQWGTVLSNGTAVSEIKNSLSSSLQTSLNATSVNITSLSLGSLIVEFTFTTLHSDDYTAALLQNTITNNPDSLVGGVINVYNAINPGANDAQLGSVGLLLADNSNDAACGDGCIAGIVIGSVLLLTSVALLLHYQKYKHAHAIPYGENVDKV